MMNSDALLKRAYMYRDWGRVGNNSEDMDERFKDKVGDVNFKDKVGGFPRRNGVSLPCTRHTGAAPLDPAYTTVKQLSHFTGWPGSRPARTTLVGRWSRPRG